MWKIMVVEEEERTQDGLLRSVLSGNRKRVMAACDRLEEQLMKESGSEFGNLLIVTGIYEQLIQTARRQLELYGYGEDIIREILDEKNATEALHMSDVAQQAYVSNSYLTMQLKEQTGKTFSEYLMEIRMEHARDLLLSTDRKTYEVAEACGMQIIPCTGFFYTENQWLFGRSEESLMECMRKDIEEGIQDTDIRPGLIKCAADVAGITPINEVLLNAHARMAKESGLPIATHTWYGNRSGIGQMDIFERHALNPKKILIGHCGDTNDIGYLEELLSRGCYIGLDRFGDDAKNPLKDRVDTLMKLCERGWIRQLMISHDYVCFVDLGMFEWKNRRGTDPDDAVYNARYIHRYVLPVLRELGFPEEGIMQLLVENPKAYFAED